ncbi:hypothetical protein [Candidatus Nanopusillus massiliensis]|nr:hypothetical protein [Candidatus Nanopusillus massiliensis]
MILLSILYLSLRDAKICKTGDAGVIGYAIYISKPAAIAPNAIPSEPDK